MIICIHYTAVEINKTRPGDFKNMELNLFQSAPSAFCSINNTERWEQKLKGLDKRILKRNFWHKIILVFCLFSSDSLWRGLKIPAWLSGWLIKHKLQKNNSLMLQSVAKETSLKVWARAHLPCRQVWTCCKNCVLTGNDFYLLAGQKNQCQIKVLSGFYVGELRLLVAFLAWMVALKLIGTTKLSNLHFWWCVFCLKTYCVESKKKKQLALLPVNHM